jgi:hypothetical protein
MFKKYQKDQVIEGSIPVRCDFCAQQVSIFSSTPILIRKRPKIHSSIMLIVFIILHLPISKDISALKEIEGEFLTFNVSQ